MKRRTDSDPARLLEILGRFPGRRIVVLGDLVADEFVYGDILRVSREAPVLILEHRETVSVPGGGANAVANLRALDASPIPVGVVGEDAAGDRIVEQLRRTGVKTRGIRAERGYATPAKSRILAGGIHTRRQQIVRIDRGASHGALSRAALSGVKARLAREIDRADGFLIADYGYGAAPPALLRSLPARARARTTVDSRARVPAFRGILACTPNQEEVERALGVPPLRGGRALEEAGRTLLRRTGNRAVLVTRGARGMSLFERQQETVQIPAFGPDEVADVTGAGDTVTAVFSLSLLSGASFPEAAALANIAAGLVVMKVGTATVSRREMRVAVEEGSRS